MYLVGNLQWFEFLCVSNISLCFKEKYTIYREMFSTSPCKYCRVVSQISVSVSRRNILLNMTYVIYNIPLLIKFFLLPIGQDLVIMEL